MQLGFCPRSRWGSLQCSPDSLARFQGLILFIREREGREFEREGRENGTERKTGGIGAYI